jgi:hypothetical protein
MPSRRRSRNKNIGNNLAEVSRRLRTIERRPVRTKLGNRIVKTSSLAPNAVGPDEVNFGTAVITTDPTVDNTYVENPKDGLFVVSSTTGATSVYSEKDDNFYPLADPTAQGDAAQAAEDAADAKDAADAAQLSADGKSAVFRQPGAPTATKIGDIWFNTNPGNGAAGDRPQRWNGTAWEPFGLNYAAISSIDANTITTGTLTGRTVQTSNVGKRIEMSNTNQLIFRGDDGSTVVGKIAPNLYASSGLNITGGDSSSTSPTISLAGQAYSGDSSITLLTPDNTGIYIYNSGQQDGLGAGGVIINGGGSTSDSGLRMFSGAGGFEFVDWSGSAFGTTIYVSGDVMDIGSGELRLSGTSVSINGDFVVSFGTYQQGSGAPTGTPAGGTGTLVFRYT